MSKKQMIRRRGLCGLLAVAMCIGVLPPTAGAAVTAKNDWEIFDASDTYNLPSTQEQNLRRSGRLLRTMSCPKHTITTPMNTAIMSRIPL